MSYYEKWVAGLIELIVKSELVTRDEIESGNAYGGLRESGSGVNRGPSDGSNCNGYPCEAEHGCAGAVQSRASGYATCNMQSSETHEAAAVRARAIRARSNRDHGVFVFPDTNAHFLGDKPQHVYSVRFAARELWGAQAGEKDAVYVDMWDEYLEPA